jgi:protein-S-isoprenylcysteine O-methyltransferase Ste14
MPEKPPPVSAIPLVRPRRHWFPKPYADTVARLRVPAGFLMLAAFAWFSHPTAATLAWGIPMSFCGLALRAWAAGHLAKNQRLAQSGPYAATRNPLYLGTLITALGLAAAGNSAALALLFAALFVLVYLPAIELEEQHLCAILPGYREYASQVPLLAPHWPKNWGTDTFSPPLYVKNQEYQALIGWLSGVAWLAIRSLNFR